MTPYTQGPGTGGLVRFACSPCGKKKAGSQYLAGNPSKKPLFSSIGCLVWRVECFQAEMNRMYLEAGGQAGGDGTGRPSGDFSSPSQPFLPAASSETRAAAEAGTWPGAGTETSEEVKPVRPRAGAGGLAGL